jgi:hypothetical protein
MLSAPGAERFVARHAAEIRALLLLGATFSVILQAKNQALGLGIETTELARSLASGRGFMLVGVPSAHSAPLFPVILAGLLKLFGDGPAFSFSVIALEIVLQWTIILLLPVVSKRLLKSAFIGYCAAAVLIPANVIFLGWESSAGAAWLEAAAIAAASPLVSGSLMGLGALLSPMVGLAVFVMHFRWNRGFALGLIVAALLCSPWTIRNYAVFHRFIPIRDSSGLAVRLSYNPFAVVSVEDSTAALYQYEPVVNPEMKQKLTAMGEADFYDWLGEGAKEWVRDNPQRSLELLARRVVAYWFPRDKPMLIVVTLLSLAALRLSWREASLRRLLFALLVVFPLPYYLVLSSPRYRMPTLWFTALLAGMLISKALEFSGRRAAARLVDATRDATTGCNHGMQHGLIADTL